MPIRMTYRDKWRDVKEAIEGIGFIVPSSEDPRASYPDRGQKHHVPARHFALAGGHAGQSNYC